MPDETQKPIEDSIIVEETTVEPVIETPIPTLETNPTQEAPIVPESVTTTYPVIEEPVVDPIVKDLNPEQTEASPLSFPATASEPPQVTDPVVSSSAPISEPTLEPRNSSLEPNLYSSNPKLNSAALAFISYMGRTKETLALANKKRKEYMMKRVYKIMDMFKKHKQVKNDDVEKFLHVSDDTATKYLNILTKEGKIKREGKKHAPRYTKV